MTYNKWCQYCSNELCSTCDDCIERGNDAPTNFRLSCPNCENLNNSAVCTTCCDGNMHSPTFEEIAKMVNGISDGCRDCPEAWPSASCLFCHGQPPKLRDSGNRREFSTGAVRDIQEGKGRCDLMPLDVIANLLDDEVIDYIGNFQTTGYTSVLYKALKSFAGDNLPDSVLELAVHFEDGAKKYGEHNWQKGIPENCYIDSAVRHYLKFLRGDTDERHDRAFIWNIVCLIWTHEHITEVHNE